MVSIHVLCAKNGGKLILDMLWLNNINLLAHSRYFDIMFFKINHQHSKIPRSWKLQIIGTDIGKWKNRPHFGHTVKMVDSWLAFLDWLISYISSPLLK